MKSGIAVTLGYDGNGIENVHTSINDQSGGSMCQTSKEMLVLKMQIFKIKRGFAVTLGHNDNNIDFFSYLIPTNVSKTVVPNI